MNFNQVLAFAICVAAAELLQPASAAAQAPVAVVEAVKGNPPGIQAMDYVVAGQTIKLGAPDTIVLGYMDSCVNETITGGTVIVGREQSEVTSGKVERSKVSCASGNAALTVQQANQSAAMVFRGVRPPEKSETPAQVTLYSSYPIIEARGGGALAIKRIDRDGETIDVVLNDSQLVRGVFYDLLNSGKSLSAGGIYRVTLNGRSATFKIDENAVPNRTAVISRLVRFGSAGN